MKCNKCNRILPGDSEFCQYCGNKITVLAVPDTNEVSSDNIKNISCKDALKSITAVQVKTTKKAYNANIQIQPNNDENSNFGLIPEKPIYTLARKSIDGEIEYLSKLRTPNGEKVKWNRRGSTSVEGINGMIDIYDIYLLSGQKYTTIYINMYGAKASETMPKGFGVQKTQPDNRVEKERNSKMDIINIFVLILPIILSIVGLFNCSYRFSDEELYSMIIFGGVIAIILKILSVTKFKKNTKITIVTACSLLIMLISCLNEDLRDEDEVIATYILICTLYVCICELYKLIKLCIEKYHATQSYKMKCYEKINLINEYRKRGIITEAEFEETRKQIVSKIR